MHVDLVAQARVQRGDHERLALVGEAEVRHERLVEDGLHVVRCVRRLVVHAADAHALGRRGGAGGLTAGELTAGRIGREVVLRPGPLTSPSVGPMMTACACRTRRPGRSDLLVALDPDAGEPLRRQLAGELRDAIRAGRLRTGVRLPASRALAAQLGVSRGVVTDAYEQLTAEGWLAARRGAGTVVAAAPAAEPAPVRAAAARRRALRLHADDARRLAVPAPPVGARGRARGGRGARRRARLRQRLRQPGAARGARRLPRPRARHRRRSRRRSSSAPATARPRGCCSASLAERGVRRVALEDPSLTDHWDAAAHAGLETAPIPLDGDGLRVDALAASRRGRRSSSRPATSSRPAR